MLKRDARQWGRQLSESVEFEFRRRYMLAPNDPRFLDCTVEDVLVDVWAHRFADDPKLRDEDVSSDFEGDVDAWEEDEDIPAGGSVADLPPDPGDFDQVEADDLL